MSNTTFDKIEDVIEEIQSRLNRFPNKKNIMLIYAFNSTGKTRFSRMMQEELDSESEYGAIKVLAYNALFEDMFVWDNENYILKVNPNNHILTFIKDQGLENQITENFQRLTLSKIDPVYQLDSGVITFNYSPGDDRREDKIKISRGEERLFVWSVFYTVLSEAISALNSDKGDRVTSWFNDLQYIIIDDPVSSVDDNRIITMAIELIELINIIKSKTIKFIVTTHHALFFNVIWNVYSRKSSKYKSFLLVLSKNSTTYTIETHGDTPFAYHIAIKNELQKVIKNNDLKKYHFNLFRGLLEKTANFLGYNAWPECLNSPQKKEIVKLINLYSHGKLSDLESTRFPDEHKVLFKTAFSSFISTYKWKTAD